MSPTAKTLGKRFRRSLSAYWAVYVMMLPGLLYLLINNYLPIFGMTIAFKKINFRLGILNSPWSGLENFRYLFATQDAFIMTRNTVLYNIAFILLGMVVGIAYAILLNEIKKKMALRVYQTLILLPHLVSWIIVSYFVYGLLSPQTGMLNTKLLPMLGIDPVQWYTDNKYWPFILIILDIWKKVGYSCIIYYSSIVGINDEYYEAATLDGASRWKMIWQITIPLIKSTIITLFLLNLGRIFYADFGLFYQIPMNSGALYSSTQVIDTYVFRALLQMGNIGLSSAASFYQSIVGFSLVMLANFVVRKISADDALF